MFGDEADCSPLLEQNPESGDFPDPPVPQQYGGILEDLKGEKSGVTSLGSPSLTHTTPPTLKLLDKQAANDFPLVFRISHIR